MNKLLIFVILFSVGSYGLAQDPNPDLFQTWHLTYIRGSDMDTPILVAEINPPVYPFMTISEYLTIVGEGACNSFEALFEHLGTNYMSNLDFFSTNNICDFQSHTMLESIFFYFMSIEWPYEINTISGGLELRMTTPIDGLAIYQNHPLSKPDLSKNAIKIYPNPSKSVIYISSQENTIDKAIIYSAIGKRVLTKIRNISEIDISNFPSGIYLLRLETKQGSTTHKIIKTSN